MRVIIFSKLVLVSFFQLKSVQNQTLVLRLTMGQVELNFNGSLKYLRNCVLMHEDDINDINALILVSLTTHSSLT